MATKMKLPIIVLCILSVVLTIGLVALKKGQMNGEELSTFEFYSEDYSILEQNSCLAEVPSTEEFIVTLEYNGDSEVKTTHISNNVYAPVVSVTKKAEEEVIFNDLNTSNNRDTTYDDELEILAKLLYCEAGGEGWDCQVYTCSAILNLSDYRGESISQMASNVNLFSVAPWVWGAKPTQTQYEVIDYVLSGGRISGVKWFRSDGRYHRA